MNKKILIYGQSGVGKTYLASTLGYTQSIIFDFDGLSQKAGVPRSQIVAMTGNPKEQMNLIKEMINKNKQNQLEDIEYIVFDSLTSFELLIDSFLPIGYPDLYKGDFFTSNDAKFESYRLKEKIINAVTNAFSNKTIVFIGHDMFDENLNKIKYIASNAFNKLIQSHFDLVGYLYQSVDQKVLDFSLQSFFLTKGVGKYTDPQSLIEVLDSEQEYIVSMSENADEIAMLSLQIKESIKSASTKKELSTIDLSKLPYSEKLVMEKLINKSKMLLDD